MSENTENSIEPQTDFLTDFLKENVIFKVSLPEKKGIDEFCHQMSVRISSLCRVGLKEVLSNPTRYAEQIAKEESVKRGVRKGQRLTRKAKFIENQLSETSPSNEAND